MNAQFDRRNPLFGIEKINVGVASLYLDIAELCDARGLDSAYFRTSLFTDQRAVLAPWEDAVTLAVNTADPMLTDEDRADIGLLIVGTESGLDQEKPLSSWIHRYLGLSDHCRHFEIKFACYGTTAGLQMAINWSASPEGEGKKALLINTDYSFAGLGDKVEPMGGAGAVAVLLSTQPRFVAHESTSGIWTADVTDVIRPNLTVEILDEGSVYSYLDALEGAYLHYVKQVGDIEFDDYFSRNVYHVPFGGMAYRAHRALLSLAGVSLNGNADGHFERNVLPSLTYTRRLGSCYGASTFIALLGLLANDPTLEPGQRIAVFAFGSGYCGEFYTAIVLPGARDASCAVQVGASLDARRRLSIIEYEFCERSRMEAAGRSDFRPSRDCLGDAYDRLFAGQNVLVLDRVENYHRHYVRT